MNRKITKIIGLPLATLFAAQGCDAEGPSRDDARAAELVDLDVEDATIHGIDEEGTVVSDASFTIDGAVSRVEMTFDDGELTTELDGSTAEVRMFGSIDGESFEWSSLSGEALPANIEARADEITNAWKAALLDENGELRADVRSAIAVREGTPDAIGYWDWWSFGCAVGMAVACGAFTGPAAVGCGIAGAVYCSAISY